MDNKKLGIILLIVGILIVGAVYFVKVKEDSIINKVIAEQGSCFLSDGTCLHDDRSLMPYIVGWVLSAVIIALGIYLIFFERSQKEIINTLENQKKMHTEEEKVQILSKAMDEYEKRVYAAIREQDGITQTTLRYRTDLSKSKLSSILSDFEKKGLIKRVPKEKTLQVFLR